MKNILSDFAQKNEELISEHGPWTAHDVYLGDGVYTLPTRNENFPFRLKKILQATFDICNASPADLTVLDLGSLEGGVGIEFARHGCKVTSIEGRMANLRKGELAKEMLSLGNISFYLDDVLNVSTERYGKFDVILCLGLLYHIDSSKLFGFVQNLQRMCDRVVIFDTHISTEDDNIEEIYHNGRQYSGAHRMEHAPNATDVEKHKQKWASLHNNFSFWPTFSSLTNMLADVDFTSILEIHHPYHISYKNRLMLAAICGTSRSPHFPEETLNTVNLARRPEQISAPQSTWGMAGNRSKGLVTRTLLNLYRRMKGRQ